VLSEHLGRHYGMPLVYGSVKGYSTGWAFGSANRGPKSLKLIR
jgi:hypothetical protein